MELLSILWLDAFCLHLSLLFYSQCKSKEIFSNKCQCSLSIISEIHLEMTTGLGLFKINHLINPCFSPQPTMPYMQVNIDCRISSRSISRFRNPMVISENTYIFLHFPELLIKMSLIWRDWFMRNPTLSLRFKA